ncbi:DUF3800 domain-containing protein [Polynucleobacter sp.]|uniref:DUF3800 domain-containing protein n=1 Tax=Polynucleobacter sp. TaxID=2029855 RepID=UPI0027334618|nr:DUF3800 domain-containing protein [Polynucleobacter sp.]MDP3122559.1 DUF3800 domain-containing protein [Polynucleobacter sp.]
MSRGLSNYLVFVDESGSPSMGNIDPDYPLFVLAFLIAKKTDYMTKITPAIQRFKFNHFGHDQVILHERDIRRDVGHFAFLKKPALKEAFLNELTDIIKELPFHMVCVVINKDEHKKQYTNPINPYHLGLEFGLERVKAFLIQEGEWADFDPAKAFVNPALHVIVEKRGNAEDNELELEFRRICGGANYDREKLNFEIIFADKKSNSSGLQIADLVARPVGVSVLKPEQPNRAVQGLKDKLLKKGGRVDGWGLKKFP